MGPGPATGDGSLFDSSCRGSHQLKRGLLVWVSPGTCTTLDKMMGFNAATPSNRKKPMKKFRPEMTRGGTKLVRGTRKIYNTSFVVFVDGEVVTTCPNPHTSQTWTKGTQRKKEMECLKLVLTKWWLVSVYPGGAPSYRLTAGVYCQR